MLGKEELLEDFPLSAFSDSHPTRDSIGKIVTLLIGSSFI
jgi:hypothetical protein